MSHVWMSHVPRMNESCPTHEWLMGLPEWKGHDRNMNEAYHTRGCALSSMLVSHVPHINESRLVCEWVMSHIWMSHIPRMKESCPKYKCVMSQIWMRHVPHMNEAHPSMTPQWHDLFICVPWLIHMCVMTHSYIHDSTVMQSFSASVISCGCTCVCVCVCVRERERVCVYAYMHDATVMPSLSASTISLRAHSLSQFECHSIAFHRILQSQSIWSLFNGTWPQRPRELDDWLRFGIGEMTSQIR